MNEDRKSWALWNIGSEISFMIERTNNYPTVEQVRNYPTVAIHCSEIEDSEIERIVNDIRRMDERQFLDRHNWLSENKPGYFGYRAFGQDENGGLVIRFVCNDDLCKKLAERLLNS